MAEKKMFDNELDPEVQRVRDQIIKKIGDKPLEEVNQIIKKLLNEQMDEVTRLGALAARVKIIRAKIEKLYNGTLKKEKIIDIKPQKSSETVKKPSKEGSNWVRVKMLETGDINGKQIDKGVVLDVQEEDANKLVETKKAEIVESRVDGASPIKKNEVTQKIENDKDEQKKSPINTQLDKDQNINGDLDNNKKSEKNDDNYEKTPVLEPEKVIAKKSENLDISDKKEENDNNKKDKIEDVQDSKNIEKKENEKSEEELLKIHEEREKEKIKAQKKDELEKTSEQN